jgi:predicted PurR-regulated permease PerM
MSREAKAGWVSDATFLRRILLVLVLLALALLVVRVANVLLLAFGAVLVAIVLHAIADPLRTRTPLGRTGSLAVAVALLALGLGVVLWLFGSQAERQLTSLAVTLPDAWAKAEQRLSGSLLGARLLEELRALDGQRGVMLAWVPRLASGAASAVTSLVIVLFAGLFLALRPENYLQGVLRLVPVAARPRATEVQVACGVALRQWLVSQVGSMLLVGVTAGSLLALAGVGSPVALGLLAGLGQFVPVVGPFVAAAPGVLLALADSPEAAAWAALIYIGVGQVESNLFSPLMLRQMAHLPMALSLFAVLTFGVLLGPLGVVFATPLAVVIFVLVRMLYIEDLLGDRAEAPAVFQPRRLRPSSKAVIP